MLLKINPDVTFKILLSILYREKDCMNVHDKSGLVLEVEPP